MSSKALKGEIKTLQGDVKSEKKSLSEKVTMEMDRAIK